jgi:hypothetical protein
MTHQELGILAREDVVGHDRELVSIAELAAEGQQQGRLSAADRTADADGKRPLRVIAVERRVALVKKAGVMLVMMLVVVRDVLLRLKEP